MDAEKLISALKNVNATRYLSGEQTSSIFHFSPYIPTDLDMALRSGRSGRPCRTAI